MHNVTIGESYTLFGQPVDVWGLNLGGTVIADIAVSEIVNKYDNEIWSTVLRLRGLPAGSKEQPEATRKTVRRQMKLFFISSVPASQVSAVHGRLMPLKVRLVQSDL